MRSGSSDKGSVTAETMMLMPALAILLSALGGIFNFGLERVSLESKTAQVLRQLSIGAEYDLDAEIESKIWNEGRLVCLELSKTQLIKISATQCTIAIS